MEGSNLDSEYSWGRKIERTFAGEKNRAGLKRDRELHPRRRGL